jgi:hypothetical protein
MWQFLLNSHSVDSDEAMKRGDEVLNASSLEFLRKLKLFIAMIFYLLSKASSPLLFTVTLPTSAYWIEFTHNSF